MIERKALIFNIQKYNMYDGPGIRTLVFFKGCPLRCRWCSNPEGQARRFEVLFKAEACSNCGSCVPVCPASIHAAQPGGRKHSIARDKECVGCRECEAACPEKALAISGELKPISEIVAVIEEDKPFYDTSGGGVTLGGGEALMQPEAAVSLLTACKQRGINTALETCGYAKAETLLRAAECTDLFLYDLKQMDTERHYRLTGVRNDMILGNLKLLLENRSKVRVRVPLLKGVNDSTNNLDGLARFLKPWLDRNHFLGVDLLPYHRLGVHKYGQLDMPYPLQDEPALDERDLARAEEALKSRGVPVSVIRH